MTIESLRPDKWPVIALLLLIGCTATQGLTDLVQTQKAFYDPSSKTVLVAAHRGAHHGNFENSIASTKNAIRLGVDIVEVDVRTTKDGYLVLMHDSKIDRTTTGNGKVEDLTLAQIRSYRLKGPYGAISQETVPTFAEFLKVAKGKIMIDVDMKTDNVSGIMAAVKAAGLSADIFYFDNDYGQLQEIRRIDPDAKLMPRAYSLQMADSAVVRFAPPVVHIDPGFQSPELAKMLRDNRARIWINALGETDCHVRNGNGTAKITELLKYGANIIQTDEPELLLALLRSEGLHP